MTINVPHIGKITASKETLVSLACIFIESGEYVKLDGRYPLISDLREKQFLAIHDALDAVGVYDRVKD